jgi:hypothetical protein
MSARGLRLVSFKPLRKGGLLGFCTIEILAIGLTVDDCPLQSTHGRIWCGLPGKPVIGQDGRHAEAGGKKQYAAILKWRDRAHSDRFSDAVVELVRRRHPEAFE